MSEGGAALQTYNQELVKCLESLKSRKLEILSIIHKEEAEKVALEKTLRTIQEKLSVVNNNLLQHKNVCDNYDRTIKEVENGFKKILESSQTLLNLAQHEAHKLEVSVNKSAMFENSSVMDY